MELGKMLLKLCKEKGWSLNKLAKESGVKQPTLHGWTTGRSVQNLGDLRKVAAALEVSVFKLAFGASDPYEEASEEILKEIFSGDVRVTLHRIERRKKGIE